LSTQFDEQHLGVGSRRKRNATLGRNANAIACGQERVGEDCCSVDYVKPGTSSREQLVNDMVAGDNQRRVDRRILVET
jgi:hypothetical protein